MSLPDILDDGFGHLADGGAHVRPDLDGALAEATFHGADQCIDDVIDMHESPSLGPAAPDAEWFGRVFDRLADQ